VIGSSGGPTTAETEHSRLIEGAMRGCWVVVVAPTFVFGVVWVVGSSGGPRKPTGSETGRFRRAAENEHECSILVVVGEVVVVAVAKGARKRSISSIMGAGGSSSSHRKPTIAENERERRWWKG